MFKIKKIQTKAVKEFFRNLLQTLAEHSFLTFLGFLLTSLILGTIIFYYFDSLIKNPPEVGSGKILKFNEETLGKVLNEWKVRDEKLLESDSKEYLNPFEISTSSQGLTE